MGKSGRIVKKRREMEKCKWKENHRKKSQEKCWKDWKEMDWEKSRSIVLKPKRNIIVYTPRLILYYFFSFPFLLFTFSSHLFSLSHTISGLLLLFRPHHTISFSRPHAKKRIPPESLECTPLHNCRSPGMQLPTHPHPQFLKTDLIVSFFSSKSGFFL